MPEPQILFETDPKFNQQPPLDGAGMEKALLADAEAGEAARKTILSEGLSTLGLTPAEKRHRAQHDVAVLALSRQAKHEHDHTDARIPAAS